MEQYINLTWVFIRFGIVGFCGMIVDFGLTYLFKEILRVNKFVANSIGFTCAASVNYLLNRTWTFHSNNPEIRIEYTKFFVVSLIGLGVNNAILWFFNQKKGYHFYFSKLLAISITLAWNFTANYLYTFTTS